MLICIYFLKILVYWVLLNLTSHMEHIRTSFCWIKCCFFVDLELLWKLNITVLIDIQIVDIVCIGKVYMEVVICVEVCVYKLIVEV